MRIFRIYNHKLSPDDKLMERIMRVINENLNTEHNLLLLNMP